MIPERRLKILVILVACAVAAGAVTALARRWPKLETAYQFRLLEGTPSAGKCSPLRKLLAKNGFEATGLPPGLDLGAETTRCGGGWVPVGGGREVFYCRAFSGAKITSKTVAYAFLFDRRGTLLGHMYDHSPGFPGYFGFADIDGDGVCEKLAQDWYSPNVGRKTDPRLRRHVFEVYRLQPASIECIFRVVYTKLGFGLPDIDERNDRGLPVISIALDDASGKPIPGSPLRFQWDPALGKITGPPGGAAEWWQVLDPEGE